MDDSGWLPGPRGMGDKPAWEQRQKPHCGAPNLASLSRAPKEATWSLHVGTHRPEHALHSA